MPNMSLTKEKMPMQDPVQRACNFEEVSTGYTFEMAVNEANRCLHCKNQPCVNGCPVAIHIPDFIKAVSEGKKEDAYNIISLSSSLPAVCGRVCPQENQCEKLCTRGIKGESVAIGRLERFVADTHNASCTTKPEKPVSNGHKVAVIGSGPSGLTCAGDLAKMGYSVTIFEALHVAGGVLVYGIPEFRLPKNIVSHEIENLKALGVDIQTDMVIGRSITVQELMDEYQFEAVFIGSGAGLPKFMSIPGENLKGVFSANEFLTRINLMKAYLPNSNTPIVHPQHTVVVGGGNVAMDAARSALRLGSKVTIVYRRTLEELPARKEEVEHAIEEGIVFHLLTSPIEIKADENGNAHSVILQCMELGEPDASGRRKPVVIPGKVEEMEADCVIMALGTSPNPLIKATTDGLMTNDHGTIVADEETGATSIPGVFAGGDAVTGAATVILAMGAGKTAAKSIDSYIQNK